MRFLFARLSPHARILIIAAGALLLVLITAGGLRRLNRVTNGPAYAQRDAAIQLLGPPGQE